MNYVFHNHSDLSIQQNKSTLTDSDGRDWHYKTIASCIKIVTLINGLLSTGSLTLLLFTLWYPLSNRECRLHFGKSSQENNNKTMQN